MADMDVTVPQMWHQIVAESASLVQAGLLEPLHALDVFGGQGGVTDACLDIGMNCYKYELMDSAAEDILSEEAHTRVKTAPKRCIWNIHCLVKWRGQPCKGHVCRNRGCGIRFGLS